MRAIPDINLLVYAYNSDAPHHEASRSWWEHLLSEGQPVGLPWVVSLGFVRLMTHRSVLVRPLAPADALAHVRSWLAQRSVVMIEPGPGHVDLLDSLLGAVGAAGNLTTDAHLAALAIEHGCILHSNDADFARFPDLRWHNPLAPSPA